MTTLTRAHIERVIHDYFAGCNEADADKMEGTLTVDAVHYFPPGMYEGPWRGRATIAGNWVRFVATLGSAWTIDRMIIDSESGQAVAEWSHFKTNESTILRGSESYSFDPASGRISEIRAYYAAPAQKGSVRSELEGFDYAAAGFALEPPSRPLKAERTDNQRKAMQ